MMEAFKLFLVTLCVAGCLALTFPHISAAEAGKQRICSTDQLVKELFDEGSGTIMYHLRYDFPQSWMNFEIFYEIGQPHGYIVKRYRFGNCLYWSGRAWKVPRDHVRQWVGPKIFDKQILLATGKDI